MRAIRAIENGYTALIFAFVAGACGGQRDAVPSSTPPTDSLRNLETATNGRLVDAINAHDAKAVAAVYAEDAVITIPGSWIHEGRARGRAEIELNARQFFDAFEESKFWLSRIWVEREVAALEYGWRGTARGEPAGAVGLMLVAYDHDGRISRENCYLDLNTVLAQIHLAGGGARPVPAPAASTEVLIAKGTRGEDENLAIAGALNGAIASKREADFLAPLTDDFEWDEYNKVEPLKGKGAAKASFEGFIRAFPDGKSAITTHFAAGDYVIQETSFTGTQTGELGPIAATKKPVHLHRVDVFRLENGKVIRAWAYENSVELMAQLGLFRPPPLGE